MGIISGSGSFRGRFGEHFRVGDHFGVGIISGAVQISKFSPRSSNKSGAIGLNTIYSVSPSALNFPGPN